MDEVAIWNRALTGDVGGGGEMGQLYSLGVGGSPIPEPSTMLFAIAGLGLIVKKRRRK